MRMEPCNDIKYKEVTTWKIWKQKRYIITLLTFLGFVNLQAQRLNISIALIAMTSIKKIVLQNGTVIEKQEFNLKSTTQGYIIGSFFYGYLITQFVGGYLATRFGGARVFGIGVATTASLTALTPFVAKADINYLIAFRVVKGAFEGLTIPSYVVILSKWAPPLEKSRLSSICLSGIYVGSVITLPLSSLFATYLGWESIFYIFGGVSLFWYAIWFTIVRDSPSKDRYINPQELRYITESINAIKTQKLITIPWYSILTSTSVWCLAFGLCCELWGFQTLLYYLPQILKFALNCNLNFSGIISALPSIAMAFSLNASGYISDWILKKRYISITKLRKYSITLGFSSQLICLLFAAFWMSPVTTPLFVVIGAMFGGMAMTSIMVNPLDIAPQYSGVIIGFMNTFAGLVGILSPIVTGHIVWDLTNIDLWKIIFYISAGIYLLGAILSTLFITGEVQAWAMHKESKQIQKLINDDKTESLK